MQHENKDCLLLFSLCHYDYHYRLVHYCGWPALSLPSTAWKQQFPVWYYWRPDHHPRFVHSWIRSSLLPQAKRKMKLPTPAHNTLPLSDLQGLMRGVYL